LVVEGPPDRKVIVEDDRVVDARGRNGLADVADVLLEGELGVCTPTTTRP